MLVSTRPDPYFNRRSGCHLYSAPPKTKTEQRQRAAAISRKLRLLRAHGLIRKRPRSHRYGISRRGRFILNAILLAHRISVRQITAIAA